jgi:hypothetical protein
LLDMARTAVNVTGDLAACRVLRRTGLGQHPIEEPLRDTAGEGLDDSVSAPPDPVRDPRG